MLVPSRATRDVPVRRVDGTSSDQTIRDSVAVEEPMEVRVSWRVEGHPATVPVAVTMRTPGDDFELAAGFLFTEGILERRDQLDELSYCQAESGQPQEYNVIQARLSQGEVLDPDRVTRNFYTSSSCGVCGKASLEAIETRGCTRVPDGTLAVPSGVISTLPDRLREAQRVFDRTGGLHAAGLFESPFTDPSVVREDVGRHNAVDKVIGRAFLDRILPLEASVLVVSGRASFEILQKAVAAGIPALVAVGAPSSLAVDLARQFNVTLIGFARGSTFNVYSGESRVE